MLITLDFETYYDQDYTLKKMSTSEYVRDARFEAISCSIKKGKKKPFCYFGHEAIQKALNDIDWDKSTLLAHHAHFDGLILSHHFNIRPSRMACTLSMARALHSGVEKNDLESVAKYYGKTNKLTMPDFKGKHLKDLTKDEIKGITAYNNTDVQSCYEIYGAMLPRFPVEELDLVDVTVRMFTDPILRVDLPRAKKELKREQDHKFTVIEAANVVVTDADIKKAVKEKAATDANKLHEARKIVLSSGPKFVAALTALGINVPMKASPTVADKMIPAIAKSDDELQALLTHPDPAVSTLVEARLAAKSTLSESRAARLIAYGTKMNLPIYLKYAGAHTLRWSGGDKLNPQNFKQKAKVGGALRECILAPKGSYLVVVDASQIEARIVAWLAGEEQILEAFRARRDIYSEFATVAYLRPVTKADKEERFVGKTCILGLGFGMGGPKLQVSLVVQSIAQGLDPVRLPLDMCYGLVNKYRAQYAEIPKLWKLLNDQAIGAMLPNMITPFEYKCLQFSPGQCMLPNGLPLLYPDLEANIVQGRFDERIQDASYLTQKGRSKVYGGLLTENVVQALARIIVANVMREVSRTYRVVMMTHDEIVFVVPGTKKDAQKALDWVTVLMATPPSWAPDLPLASEGGFDTRYSK